MMASQTDDSIVYNAEWYDKLACVNKPFKILFYPQDGSVEIIDVKARRQHLKRIKHDLIREEHLYIGATVEVYGRRFKIIDFGDEQTKKAMKVKNERSFCFIKPDAYMNMGKIIQKIQMEGFLISKAQMLKLNTDMVSALYAH
jgi:nucleoside-diphosphate kinase